MKSIRIISSLIVYFLTGCANQLQLKPEEKIVYSECNRIIEISKKESQLHKGSYCLTGISKLENLRYKTHISYIGSNDEYHFFYWYLKKQIYENRPIGFAVPLSSYEPKNKFNINKSEIGEKLFIE
jgi:uncharacterized protein YcfL